MKDDIATNERIIKKPDEIRKEDSPKILVVDDDAGIRDLLSSILTDCGYHIRSASNGHVALSSVASEAPDLILLDVEMPGMNGYEVCHQLKSDERSRGIPVIFCSGLEDTIGKVKGFKAGGVDYITKPFQSAEVLSRVKTHLDLRRMQKRLEDMVEERTAELRIANEQLRQDLIERKQAEEAMRDSEEKYRSLASTADSMCLIDRECRYLFMNERFLERFGLVWDEVVGKTYGEFHSEEDTRAFAETIENVFIIGTSVQHEYSSERDERYFLRTFSPVKDREGKITTVTVVSKDITDRKHAEEELKHSFELLRKALGAIIQAMVVVVETRDPYTAGHQRRVSSLARAIAAEMDLPSETIDGIRMAGIIHDIGKIAVPAEILSKPTKLSEIEFSMIKIHAQAGYDILKEIEFPWPVAQIVFQHHEKIDGSGYPQGLRGDDILLEAKILSIADVVEAIASHRPYRPALGIEKALEEISRERGILYDPEGVDACIRLFCEKGYKMEE